MIVQFRRSNGRFIFESADVLSVYELDNDHVEIVLKNHREPIILTCPYEQFIETINWGDDL